MLNDKLWARDLDYFPLTNLSVILTQKCNLKCDYCLRDTNSAQKNNQEVPFEKLKYIIISAHRSGCRKTGLTGGEFYLYSKWRDLIFLLGQLKWSCLIETNGVALSENPDLLELPEREIGSRLSVLVSLDSYDEKKHDLHRGKGTFKKAVKAINLIASKKIKLIANAILTPDNMMTTNDVKTYIGFCKNLGINYINIGRVVAEARGNNRRLTLSLFQEKQMVDILYQYDKENQDKSIRHGFFQINGQRTNCGRIGREICISPFGLHPCVFHQEIKIGNLDDFENLIWSEFFQSFNVLQKCSRIGHQKSSFTCYDCVLSLPKYIKKLQMLELVSI